MEEEKKVVYGGRYITVTEQTIGDHTYERMVLRPGVCVIPAKDGEILLIKEFRAHEKGARWKAVSGWMDKDGLDDLATAKEELAEEIGMASDKWEKLPRFDIEDKTINMETSYFIAHNPYQLKNPPKNPDHDEIEQVRWVSLRAYEIMLENGEMMWDRDALYILQTLKMLNASSGPTHKKIS